MSFDFTPSQRLAIESTGGAVLVSAAAGSGKTRVLTERLIRRVADVERPVDIDRFLVITYTRAAAAELRGRIMEALGTLAAAQPENLRLRRQQTLCCRARIGTIHSFCTEVIRENCHRLGVPPTFTVMDEERAEQLKVAVLSRLLDRRYERIGDDAAFRLLVDTVGAGRDDRRLESTVQALYTKLRSQPWPADWAAAQKAALELEGVTDVGETVWGKELLDAARDAAEEHIAAIESAVREITEAGGAGTKYEQSLSATAAALRDFRRALDLGWDKARAFCDIPFPRLTWPRDYDPERKGRAVAARDACKAAAKRWREMFDRDSASLLGELKATAPAMGALIDLTLELDAAFSAEKRRRGSLDFSDLEHYAASLLVDRESGGPTWIAVETASRFAEVMVDEYQDVSLIQDLIFRAVSRQGKNLFLVGDVKQSIYRFRLADPSLFLEKYNTYKAPEDALDGEPRRILLRENFRSRAAVLDAANLVFSNIMSEKLGELDYDDAAALKYGALDYPEGTDVPAEFDLIDAAALGDADEVPPEKSELEARFVANRILSMMNAGTPVYGPDGPRRCDWGDFVLLLRSPGSRGSVFHRVLAEHGIPVQSGQGGGFFTSLEITVAVDLLSLVDNPHADVPLISALRSPVFGFSPDALSAIRAGSRDTDFYTAVRAAAEAGDGQSAGFLAKLDAWRAIAPDLPLDALLWRVCGDTDLFAVCSAMSGGETRRDNLMRLFEYARAFSESGYRGVFRFVSWLRRLAEKGAEPETSAGENAVRILSIHKSKGLEFPFVFLCGLDQQFNKSDARESVLLHSELGLGPKYTDADAGIEYPTVARRAIEHRLTTEMLSEEMRVLYVAMTRARERLIMTATLKNAAAALEKLRPGVTSPVSPAALRTAPCPARWVALAALTDEKRLKINVVETVKAVAPEPPEAPEVDAAGAELYARLCENLGFVYPHAGSVELPSRLTATELKGAEEADADAETLAPPEAAERFEFRRAEPGRPRRLTAAERGTATHSFLQYVDFSRTGTEEQLRGETERIAAAGLLRPEEAEAVDTGAILKLFTSPLGKAMREAKVLRREFRFTLLADAADYFEGAGGEDQLLLQGVVDCFFVEDGEITVVDYKTDRVTADGAKERAERYRGQLETYAKALRRITGLPVRRRVLWFLRPGVEIEVKV